MPKSKNPAVAALDEVWGGLAATLVALPSSIAFGVLVYSVVGPEYQAQGALAGILGAAVLGIVAPLVSRNGGFITAPCAPAAAVLSAVALQFAGADQPPDRIVQLLFITALLSSVLQMLYGLIGAGSLIKFIPYQVVSGYLSGVAILIAVGQLPKLLGLPKATPLIHGLASPELWNWTGISVGIVTILAMTLAPRITEKIPAAILGLASGIVAYFLLSVANPELLRLTNNPLIIGPISATGSLTDGLVFRLSMLFTIRPADIGMVLVSLLTLSVLLSIDTLKTGVIVDSMLHRRHNSDRELLGQGLGNFASTLVGGMPGAGTMGPTLVNINSGGRSYWSGVLAGGFVVAAFLIVGSVIAWVPIGALAGLLLVIAWRMFDRRIFALALNRSTRLDFAVIVTVIVIAQFDLIVTSVTGILLAILLFIRDQIRCSVIVSKLDLSAGRSKRRRLAAEVDLLAQHGNQAMVVQLYGNLFFGTTDRLFSALESDFERLRYLLLDLRRVQSMDLTAAHLLEQMNERLRERGGELLISGMPSNMPTRIDIDKYLHEIGLLREGKAGIRVFDTRESAIEWMENKILESAGWQPQDEKVPLSLAEIELFSGLGPEDIAALSQVVTERSAKANEHIFSAGDRGNEMYLIRRGRVNALLPLGNSKRHHLATFEAGDFFGELAFIDDRTRTADAEAAAPCDLFVLSRSQFDGLMSSRPALSSEVLNRISIVLSKRLRVADTELHALEQR